MARPADPNAHAALVAAARAQFKAHGLKGARIEDITAQCGLSKGAFYLHFPSKEALFKQLVDVLDARFEELARAREAGSLDFIARHGVLTARDVTQRSARYEALLAQESLHDRALLELFWDWRDVFHVLDRGSQGSEFDGLAWKWIDRELRRVIEAFDTMKRQGACRDDVPSEVCGSMIIGTYLMVARQLSGMSQRPNLDLWVDALQRLIRDGFAPYSTLQALDVAPAVAVAS
jgi:AcrR family transcriptional regulator